MCSASTRTPRFSLSRRDMIFLSMLVPVLGNVIPPQRPAIGLDEILKRLRIIVAIADRHQQSAMIDDLVLLGAPAVLQRIVAMNIGKLG